MNDISDVIGGYLTKARLSPDDVKKKIISDLLVHDTLFKQNLVQPTLSTSMFHIYIRGYLALFGETRFRKFIDKKLSNNPETMNAFFDQILLDVIKNKNAVLLQDFLTS